MSEMKEQELVNDAYLKLDAFNQALQLLGDAGLRVKLEVLSTPSRFRGDERYESIYLDISRPLKLTT